MLPTSTAGAWSTTTRSLTDGSWHHRGTFLRHSTHRSLVGIYSAVTRKGISGRVFGADEGITVEEAVRGYTLTGAYITFDEEKKGSLEPGTFADMIVLSDDILTVDPEQIMDIQIEPTWLAGELVYERKSTIL